MHNTWPYDALLNYHNCVYFGSLIWTFCESWFISRLGNAFHLIYTDTHYDLSPFFIADIIEKWNDVVVKILTFYYWLFIIVIIIKRVWINKSHIWTADKDVNLKAIFAVMNTTWAVVRIRPEKKSGLYGIWSHDLCDTGAVRYQLS